MGKSTAINLLFVLAIALSVFALIAETSTVLLAVAVLVLGIGALVAHN